MGNRNKKSNSGVVISSFISKIYPYRTNHLENQARKTKWCYLKCHLTGKNQFVTLEQTTSSVLKYRVRYAIDEVRNSTVNIRSWFSLCNGLLEDHAEGLRNNIATLYIEL